MRIPKEKICLYTPVVFGDKTMRTTISEAARLDVGGVELMNFCQELTTPDIAAARELADMARSFGLKLPCFSVAADILTDPDGSVKKIKAYTDICAELGIPLLHHTVASDFTAWDIDDTERERRFEFCAGYALELAEYANSVGVRTVIEDQGFVFNGVKNCARLCELSGERIGIVGDSGNIMFFDEKPADFIRAMGQRVVHAHLKDYLIKKTPTDGVKCYRTRLSNYLTEVGLGDGSADIDDVLQAFADIGYDGMYSLEYSRDSDCDVETMLDYLTK